MLPIRLEGQDIAGDVAKREARALLASRPSSSFARLLLQNFDVPVSEYMQAIYSASPVLPIEDLFLHVLRDELEELKISKNEIDQALASLGKHRVIQTTPHVTLTNGPSFLGANWLAASALPGDAVCLVGAVSHVPYSNDARSAAISFGDSVEIEGLISSSYPRFGVLKRSEKDQVESGGERRITFLPASMARACVFGTEISPMLREAVAYLKSPVAKFFSGIEKHTDFCQYAMIANAAIDSHVLKKNIRVFDLCSLVSKYLQLALQDGMHPMSRLLFGVESRQHIDRTLGSISLFVNTGKFSERYAPVTIDGDRFFVDGEEFDWNPENVIRLLACKKICPGLFTVFSVLLLNGIQCLGGFLQVQYLPAFRSALASHPLLGDFPVGRVPVDGLTFGRMHDVDGRVVYPIDVVLGKSIQDDSKMSVGEFATSLILNKRWMR